MKKEIMAKINSEGCYCIRRPRNGKLVWVIQCCPYASGVGGGVPCGDWCPDFDTSEEFDRVVIYRCRGKEHHWKMDSFVDERLDVLEANDGKTHE